MNYYVHKLGICFYYTYKKFHEFNLLFLFFIKYKTRNNIEIYM